MVHSQNVFGITHKLHVVLSSHNVHVFVYKELSAALKPICKTQFRSLSPLVVEDDACSIRASKDMPYDGRNIRHNKNIKDSFSHNK